VNAPDMIRAENRHRIGKIVEEFEEMGYCIGRNGTQVCLQKERLSNLKWNV